MIENKFRQLCRGTSLVALAAAITMPTFAVAKEEGDLLIRARAIYITPDESATISLIGGDASVGNEVTVELDFSYFISDNIAVELILATSKHSVSAVDTALGDLDLGSVWLLPPTLSLQYHLQPKEQFSPYVGVSANLTLFHSINSGPVADKVSYDTAIGYGLQAGVDYEIGEGTYINFDIKRLWLSTDVTIDATTAAGAIVAADVKLNPWIFGIGIGKTF